jgi:hypothetical protein
VRPMTPIAFRVNPAFVTLGDALEMEVAHMRAIPSCLPRRLSGKPYAASVSANAGCRRADVA